jgi:16S rRNA (cytosine1402-N4)-methyltransferase
VNLVEPSSSHVEHRPVLLAEVLDLLRPSHGGCFVDCTVGLGGHTRALLDGGASRVVGLDRDADALMAARPRLGPLADRVELVHADFRDLGRVLDDRGIGVVAGVVADLGVSSMQLDAPGRGFSFRRDEPLDMRMDRTQGETAADLIARLDEHELADVIFRFGEERRSRRVARAIVSARARGPLRTTGELASIVRRAVGGRSRQRIDPATRTFQALRIRVNGELEGLDGFLVEAGRRLDEGGRLAVIAFHSLEDRIVKQTFRSLAEDASAGVAIVTRRPQVPSPDEIRANPRARSAKLRALERVHRGQGAPGSREDGRQR